MTRDEVLKILDVHNKAFWTVFTLHLTKMTGFSKVGRYCFSVRYSIWEKEPELCAEFIKFLKWFRS